MAPQVNSEFYTGWLDHWGDQHAVVDSRKVSRVLDEMLAMGASVNMYVSSHTPSSHIWPEWLFYWHQIRLEAPHLAAPVWHESLEVFFTICDLV